MKYELINKWLPELNTHSIDTEIWVGGHNQKVRNIDFIKASDLEAELAKGVEVFGELKSNDIPWPLTKEKHSQDTHSGLLIGYKPIESSKPVSREEIEQFYNSFSEKDSDTAKLLKRILDKGMRNE